MATTEPDGLKSGSDAADEVFGWQLFHDRQRNLVYYLHSYTGEVRWPRPETVGFVMHGLKPLPFQAGVDIERDASAINPDIWSPYYPHVVMLPSGLMQVHPGPISESQGVAERWCGYNRFPLWNHGPQAEQYNMRRLGLSRLLPPTWEDSSGGLPFLPPHPVAVLGHDDMENKHLVAPVPPLHAFDQFQTPEAYSPHFHYQAQNFALGEVQSFMNRSTHSQYPSTIINSATEGKQPGYPKGMPAPNLHKKEHNRKGYLLRQARKMMRDNSSSSTTAAETSFAPASRKQRTTRSRSSTTRKSYELDNSKRKEQQATPTMGDVATD
ncbi:hypothetical protein CCR75_003861 [Bremia lactucae]|uniref:WW domain-containing protein n=1 Tax=Bremia lactucae TaxID=4779 RepID=A0A976NX96_BRELC|nr:hypothetical protein CCR75_003861 [Bremia lactucae]